MNDFFIVGQEFYWGLNDEKNKWEKRGPSQEAVDLLVNMEGPLFFDTETTGLRWAHGDKVFSFAAIGLNTPNPFYFNFQDYKQLQMDFFDPFEPDWVIKDKEFLRPLFKRTQVTVGHNIKFDFHMSREFGFPLESVLVDTMVTERLLSNDDMSYSLAKCVERHIPHLKKGDAVEEYIDQKGLYHMEDVPGKKTKYKNKYYYLVPFRIIAPYAANDVLITRELHKNQVERLTKIPRPQAAVWELEGKVLKLCTKIEQRGVLVDQDYCEKGVEFEDGRANEVKRWFQEQYGKKFVDSAPELGPIFESLGFKLAKTEENNDSIAGYFLEDIQHELARKVEIHRDAVKRGNTYFRSFINLADKYSVLHPDMKQAGTRTGRFSYSDPNLQNVPKEDMSTFPVRRAIVPRTGHFFVSIDYAQQEFRMMLDYAGEMELIARIKDGYDPHTATAELCGITRKEAKTINFGLMYGMGIQKLANRLGITYDEAKKLKWKYFGALPKVKELIYTVTDVAKTRGAVYTWMNRKCDFKNPEFAYKAINAIIQGGCADVTKKAMLNCESVLSEKKTVLALQIHDELLFELPYSESAIVPELQRAMESVYPHKHIPLTTSVSFSLKSFYDMQEAKSIDEIQRAVREHVQRESEKILGGVTEHLVH